MWISPPCLENRNNPKSSIKVRKSLYCCCLSEYLDSVQDPLPSGRVAGYPPLNGGKIGGARSGADGKARYPNKGRRQVFRRTVSLTDTRPWLSQWLGTPTSPTPPERLTPFQYGRVDAPPGRRRADGGAGLRKHGLRLPPRRPRPAPASRRSGPPPGQPRARGPGPPVLDSASSPACSAPSSVQGLPGQHATYCAQVRARGGTWTAGERRKRGRA